YQIYTGHVFMTIPEVADDGSWARVRALYNPLVLWVWYGGGIMVFGAFLNIFRPRRKEVYPATGAAATVSSGKRAPFEEVPAVKRIME
ncbi:MAG: cytochrome c-type biogenesis CcmF C-terminal domain-containing protein, partial [Nitrospiria bacterium]